ncbi:MAG: pyridoxamine 5'-phosphate oxidase family protein [bacterium]|nr:pyridoxamine 5'-phosphate oxidase family protein [bacterium]
MMHDRALEEKIRTLLAGQKLASLSTSQNDQPYASLVAFAETDDLKTLLFATTRSTRKFANLTANGRVALLVDNRSSKETVFYEAMAATALGTSREVRDSERNACLNIYLAKHPQLKDFVASPTCALLEVTVDRYYAVSRFQNVQELHVTT